MILVALLVAIGMIWNPFPVVQAGPEGPPVPPKFRVDPFWGMPLPDRWVTGSAGGVCVDSQDHLFVVARGNLTSKQLRMAQPSPKIIEFDPDGNVVNWATPPELGSDWHSCYVDHEDNVWVAGGPGDHIVQKYSHDLSTLLLQTGTKGVRDTTNSSTTLLAGPTDVAVDPDNGDVYISDGYGNRRLVVFDKDGNYLRQWGSQSTVDEARAGVGGKFLSAVHCVNLGQDGLVYVCDRKSDRIQVFDKMGNFIRNIWVKKGVGIEDPASIGSACDMAFSTDKRQTFIYVTNMEEETMVILAHESGELLDEWGGVGHNAGQFNFLHTVSVDSKGNLYTGETWDGLRFQVFKAIGHQPAK